MSFQLTVKLYNLNYTSLDNYVSKICKLLFFSVFLIIKFTLARSQPINPKLIFRRNPNSQKHEKVNSKYLGVSRG